MSFDMALNAKLWLIWVRIDSYVAFYGAAIRYNKNGWRLELEKSICLF